MMRKIFFVLASAMVCGLAFVSCGKDEEETQKKEMTDNTEEDDEEEANIPNQEGDNTDPETEGSVYADKCELKFVFDDENKTAVVAGFVVAKTSIDIPSKVIFNGVVYTVTKIENSAFGSCTSLKKVTLPNTLKEIGGWAFGGCTGLTNIEIPNSVKEIGSSAFSGCTGLTSVEIPKSVTEIGQQAFYECTSLTEIKIPNSVTKIGVMAFYGCWNLTIEIPTSVTEIEGMAVSGCKTVKLSCPITDNMFRGDNGLVSVEITSSVTEIGESAFYYCSNLKSVTISNSVKKIKSDAFRNTRLEYVWVSKDCDVDDSAFNNGVRVNRH